MNDKEKQNEPIRILQYIGSLNSGGSQSMILNIYKKIDRKKVQFDFIVDRCDELFYKEDIEDLGGKVYVLRHYFKGINYFQYISQWKTFLKQHPEYKVIHCHVRSVASIVLMIAKKYGLTTICHSHNMSNGQGLKSLVKRFLQGRIKRNCDYFFACSTVAAEWLYGKKIAYSDKCKIINNAINIDDYRFNKNNRESIRRYYAIDDEICLIGHVGRFEEQKNHKFIYELIETFRNEDKVLFMLCGDGSLKKDFQEKIRLNKLEKKVIYVPTTKDINKYYSAFDFFIMPSLYEGLGMVLIEAQFSGLTCLVAPNIPEEAKISENYIVEYLEIKKWREKIYKRQKIEAREKVRLYENAKEFDATKTAKWLQGFYLSCSERIK